MNSSSAKFNTGVSNTLVTAVTEDIACCSNVKKSVCISCTNGIQEYNELVIYVYTRPTTFGNIIDPHNVKVSNYCNNFNACHQPEFCPYYFCAQQIVQLIQQIDLCYKQLILRQHKHILTLVGFLILTGIVKPNLVS